MREPRCSTSLERVSRRAFRLLLRLYPAAFRRRFAGEMEDVFAARCREVLQRYGGIGVVSLWLRTLPGLMPLWVRARTVPWRSRGASRSRTAPTRSSSGKRRMEGRFMDRLIQDLFYGARGLVKSPAFAATATLTLALGIGANTAIFSIVNGLLLRPLPHVEDPDRLVAMYTSHGGESVVSSYMDYLDIRERAEAFSDVAAYKSLLMDLSAGDITERVEGVLVSGSYFEVLGAQPEAGRFFAADEDRDLNAETVAVLGHGLWTRRFGGDPAILGAEIVLNGRSFTVVGVAPRDFRGTMLESAPEVFVPITMQPHFMPTYGNLLDRRGWGGIFVVGRLRDGVGIEQAQANLDSIAAWLKEQYPDVTEAREYWLVPFGEARLLPGSRSLAVRYSWMLAAIVGMVLLVACVNVANLLLARAGRRGPELAVRQAMGAGRWRLVRQLLVESLLLAILGGGAGLALALVAVRALAALPWPLEIGFSIDARVLAYAVGLSLLTVLLFGAFPALRMTRPGVVDSLGRGGGSRGLVQGRVGQGLVVVQVALSLVLLLAAGLFVRSLAAVRSVDPGFDPDRVLVATLDPSLQGYGPDEVRIFYERVLESARGLPGVESASFVNALPGPRNDNVQLLTIEGYQPTPEEEPEAFFNIVGVDYFRTMGIPVLRGRTFHGRDRERARPVAVLNQTAARQLEARTSRPALSNRIGIEGQDGPFFSIVGVVGDSKTLGLREDPDPRVYFVHGQAASSGLGARMTLLVRTGADPLRLVPSLRSAVAAVDPNLPLFEIGTLEAHLAETLLTERYATTLLSVFALLGLALAAVGLHGVLSVLVSQRSGELGVRLALGATPADLVRMVTFHGLALVGVGMVLGLILARTTAGMLSGFLYGVAVNDVATVAAASGTLLAVAFVASYLPGRRATGIDPVAALRAQ